MRLTGIPLILLTATATVVAVAATVRFRRRFPVRAIGVLTIEILVVAEIGLIANRQADFYPSWQALSGTEHVTVVAPTAAGHLDGALDQAGTLSWSPPEATAWHLTAPPRLLAPPEYTRLPDRTFPVLVVLTGATTVKPTRGVLTVVLSPGPRTTANTFTTLPASLSRDARAAAALAIAADPPWRALAAAWPGHPAVLTGIDQAARNLPEPLAPPRRLPS